MPECEKLPLTSSRGLWSVPGTFYKPRAHTRLRRQRGAARNILGRKGKTAGTRTYKRSAPSLPTEIVPAKVLLTHNTPNLPTKIIPTKIRRLKDFLEIPYGHKNSALLTSDSARVQTL